MIAFNESRKYLKDNKVIRDMVIYVLLKDILKYKLISIY